MTHSHKAALAALAEALDARDPYTAGHGARVAALSVEIGQVMHVTPAAMDILRVGANLHDIGKVGIPDSILLKPAPLTEQERGLMQVHTRIGRRILSKLPGLEPLLPIVELHHENFNGSGYPYGLRGEHLPLLSRIVRVADVFDAMITDRVYRAARSREEVIEHIRSGAGTQFDPDVVAAFTSVISSVDNAPSFAEPLYELERVWVPA